MVKTNLTLLDKLNKFSLDNPEASFSFSDRLCRENGWNKTFANKVIDEYKKFILLSKITGKSLTPSDEVDQAWHLHLVYSRSYWVDMCENLLDGFKLHHGPTKGGVAEATKYNEQYQYTLDIYKEILGYEAPSDVWPSLENRFSPVEFKRIDVKQNIVLSKHKVKEYGLTYLAPIFGFITMFLLMSNTTTGEAKNDWGLVYWIIGLVVVIFIIRGIYRYINRDERRSSSSSSYSSDSGCGVISSFFGCGSDSSGCGSDSSGCGSSGCGSSCGGGCGGD